MRLLPEDPFSLTVAVAPDEVSARLVDALRVREETGGRRDGRPARLGGRVEGDRGILWLDGPFGGNAFRRRLRLRVVAGPDGTTRIEGTFAVHPRVRVLFGALILSSIAFFLAGTYVALNERTLLPFPFLSMPFVLWLLRVVGLALSRAEEKRLCELVENAARLGAP